MPRPTLIIIDEEGEEGRKEQTRGETVGTLHKLVENAEK